MSVRPNSLFRAGAQRGALQPPLPGESPVFDSDPLDDREELIYRDILQHIGVVAHTTDLDAVNVIAMPQPRMEASAVMAPIATTGVQHVIDSMRSIVHRLQAVETTYDSIISCCAVCRPEGTVRGAPPPEPCVSSILFPVSAGSGSFLEKDFGSKKR